MGEKTAIVEGAPPERLMVRRALVGGALAVPVAYGVGYAAGGRGGGLSALIGVVVVVANFAAHGLSLAWAARVSIPVLQGVALGGFALRMLVIIAVLFALDRTAFFSPVIFGLTAVVATMVLLAYEARLVLGGVGGGLLIPPDPAAAAAGRELRLREEVR